LEEKLSEWSNSAQEDFEVKQANCRPAPFPRPRQFARNREIRKRAVQNKLTMSTAAATICESSDFSAPSAPSASPLDFVVLQTLAKQGKKAILSQLSARWGLSEEKAKAVLSQADDIKREACRKESVKALLTGLVILGVGFGMTFFNYSAPEDTGYSAIAYALLIVGAMKFLGGLGVIMFG
jgi:hypothetical protein